MIRSNYHTHTEFCDGHSTAAQMAAEAAAQGFDWLGFSSHSMYPFSDDWHIPARQHSAYIAEVSRLQRLYAGRMQILCGFEADFVPGLGSFGRLRDAFSPDFIIGSVHFIFSEKGWFAVDGSAEEAAAGIQAAFGGNAQAAVQEYFSLQREMLRHGGFTIWGHPDLVWKLNPQLRWFKPDDSWYLSELKATAEEAARAARNEGIIVEINTGGMARGKTAQTYPAMPFLERLRVAGIPATYSSDCHNAPQIGFGYELALECARRAGYTELAYLEGGAVRFQRV